MSMVKESKVRLLENYYGLDFVAFGKPVKKVNVCCPFFREEYISAKGALLSCLIEIYKMVDYKPAPITESLSMTDLIKKATKSAKVARENAKELVTTKNGIKDIKESLRESIQISSKKKVNINNLVNEHVRRKALSLAVDSLLLGRVLKESPNFKKFKSWQGKILEESYKTLRDNFVENCMVVIENIVKEK